VIIILQSGVIGYRRVEGKLEILLVSSASGKRWGIPKGWIDLKLTAAESAAKEAWEEAGVRGRVQTPAIGYYNTRKFGFPCQVEVFLMEVDTIADDYPEANTRKRQWVTPAKATKLIHKSGLKKLVKQLETLTEAAIVSS